MASSDQPLGAETGAMTPETGATTPETQLKVGPPGAGGISGIQLAMAVDGLLAGAALFLSGYSLGRQAATTPGTPVAPGFRSSRLWGRSAPGMSARWTKASPPSSRLRPDRPTWRR